MQGIVTKVNGAVNRLEATWKGISHDRFMGEYPGWKQNMTNFIQMLRDISTRIEKETNEIEQADQACWPLGGASPVGRRAHCLPPYRKFDGQPQ